MLKPQDIVILLKILSTMTLPAGDPNKELTQNELARLVVMSPSEVNAGIKRLVLSGLLGSVNRGSKYIFLPIKSAVEDCLISGVRYFFPAQLGVYTRGIPTGYASPVLQKLIVVGDEPIPVWPYAEGTQRGVALEPLYRSVPDAIMQHPDPLFYDMLALTDAIRIGRVRERNIAVKLLKEIIHGKLQKNESHI